MTGEKLDAVGIKHILGALPHRYPFLLVDRIYDIQNDEQGVGVKNVSISEPFFQGSFPCNPVMPGVLVLEGMAQTAGVLCIRSLQTSKAPQLVYFLTIDKARFHSPAVPGDVLEYHVKRIRRRNNAWWYHGEATIEGRVVAQADLGAMIIQSKSSAPEASAADGEH